MRHAVLLLAGLIFSLPVYAQSFIVEDARPQHGSAGVTLSSEVAFAFSEEISVGTDWNREFVFEPSDDLRFNQVSLCLNFEGACAGGDDVPRFVRFQAEHQLDTDYTWMVYAVETPGGDAMDEPFVLRYTTAASIGEQAVAGTVQTPIAKAAAWTPQVRTSLRTLARGLKRNGLGQPFFDQAPTAIDPDSAPARTEENQVRSHFGTIGSKSHSGGHTQILLLSDFSDSEAQWAVRAADVISGASGDYTVEYLREETFWPVAVRYTDGANTEIEAFGYYDANDDGAPDPVSTESGSLDNIDIQLYEFPLTAARAQGNLDVAIDSAAAYADDQELKIVQAGEGARPAGTAYQWTYRFYSPSNETETRVTVDPLDVTVNETVAGGFLTEMTTIPESFIDSDEALQIALNDGGQEFIDPFRPNNITTILQGGNLYWTDTPVPTEEFWRVRIITATSTQVRSFDRYIDMETGDILDASDNPEVPAAPVDFAGSSGDGEVALTWAANTEDDLAEYRLYRSVDAPQPGGTIVDADNLITTIAAGTQSYVDTDVTNGQAYVYQLTAADTENLESTPSPLVNAFPYPASLDVNITRSFGDPSQQRNYRLVALPGNETTPVASTLDGAADEAWTVYWDNGSSDNFLQKYDGSSTFGFQPGRGFWMLSREAWAPSQTVDAVPLTSEGTYAIDLHEGWNIVSNPFGADVPWAAVQAENGITQALWRWNGSFSEATTFESAQGGEAFYFLNEQDLDQLVLPYPGAPSDVPAVVSAARRPGTSLKITALQNGNRMSEIQAGVVTDGAVGRDAFDQFAPPGYFEGATLRLTNPAVDATYSALAVEYRPSGREGHTFDLSLQAEPGQVVQLQAEGAAAFDGQKVVLVDPATGRAYDLQAEATVKLRPSADETNLKLLVGSSAFVDRAQSAIVPTTLQLLPNYPNPFRTHTTLEFTLPERRDVRLVIYDVLGRRVRTLVDRSFDAGRHTMRWDGRNASGQPVASGIYLGRLEVGDQRHVQRLVLVR